MALPIPAPLFLGQTIFGDTPSFSATQFTLANAVGQIDAFLGLVPGTTKYGVTSGGRCWGLSGLFIERTTYDVQNDQYILRQYANLCATLGLATNLAWPGNYYQFHNCRYITSELVIGTVVPSPGTQYQSSFKLVVRQVSNSP